MQKPMQKRVRELLWIQALGQTPRYAEKKPRRLGTRVRQWATWQGMKMAPAQLASFPPGTWTNWP
jgi:hypothetical protein